MAYYRFIEHIEKYFDEESEDIVRNLKETAELIFRKENLMFDLTCSDVALIQTIQPMIQCIEKAMPESIKSRNDGMMPESMKVCLRECMNGSKTEAYTTSGMVQYDACAGDFIQAGYEFHGALNVLKVMMNYDYLWIKLRVQGGAYGCMSGFATNGSGYFTSYRDPNLKETYDVYEGAIDYVKNFEADERTMRKYIIGAISGIDTPLGAADQGARSLNAWMCHTSYEKIEKNRYELLHTDVKTIRSLAGIVEAIVHSGIRCVVGSTSKIEENREMFQKIEPLFGA